MTKFNFKKIIAGFMLTVYMITSAGSSYCVTNMASDVKLRQPLTLAQIALEGETVISKNNPKITISLRYADVKQVLRMFADKAGKNIVFHPSALVDTNFPAPQPNMTPNNEANASIEGERDRDRIERERNAQKNTNNKIIPVNTRIALDLVNVPLNDAFKMVLKLSGLTYFMEGNTIVVLSQQEAKTSGIIKKELRTIPVKYIDASGIARFLNKNVFSKNRTGLSNTKTAVTNTSTNELIIIGTENDYLLAKKVVEQFDKKPLEETFVLNHTTPREMAYLICEVLFKNLKLMQNEEDDEDDDDENDDDSKGSSNSSSSSSNSSSNSSQTSNNNTKNENIALTENERTNSKDLNDIILGRGLIACQYNNRIKNEKVQSLHSGGLTVTYFSTKGTVSVMGASAEQMQQVRDFVKEQDTKQLQAFIELSIIELNEKGSKEFHNMWDIYTGFFSASFNLDGLATDNPIFLVGDRTPNSAKFNGPNALSYSIKYLIENNKGRILSNPKIIVTNGEKSIIDLTKDYIKTVKTEIIETAGGGYGTNGIQKTITLGNDLGIKVELSPFISRDGYVTLNIKPQYSTQYDQKTSEDALGNENVDATLLSRRNLDLRGIRLKDGDTLVIGGMISEEEHKNVLKFPFLAEIPGIGAFFRSTDTTREKNELVIMVTPRIIDDKDELVKKEIESGTAL